MFEEPETLAKWTDECYWVNLIPRHTALRERRDASATVTGRLLHDFHNTLCSGHDFFVTPARLIEGTAARPSYDSPMNCVTGPRLAHDRHGIIILNTDT